jgi:molecular chaperone DnaK
MKRGPIVGIDLGTTYSTLAYLNENLKPQALANAEGEFTTPSAVYVSASGSGIEVGNQAVKSGLEDPERFIANAKRYLGEPEISWEVDGVEYTPVDVLAFVLRKLLRDAEPQLGHIDRAVITVPAHYTGMQRALTIEAGKQAGLARVDIINEPVAAALCFALGRAGLVMTYLHEDSTFLVYDLGGGTFDLSLVRYDTQQLRVLATSGEKQLGALTGTSGWSISLPSTFSGFTRRISAPISPP